MKRDLVVEAETAFLLEQTDSRFDLLFKHLQGEQWHGANATFSTLSAQHRTANR